MVKEDKKKSKSTKASKSTKSKKTSKAKKPAKLSIPEKKALKVERKKAVKRDVKNMGFFERLRYKRKLRRDREARRRAEDLATLPKEPIKRFFAHLSPKRVFHYWFSWRGVKRFFKFVLACMLLGIIAVGALFLYYKKDIADIKLDDIVISDTVNTYLDRNGVVLWEDTGTENYRLVVSQEEMSDYVRWATIALEDRNFYSHPGVDFSGLMRAVIATASGKQVQGGSTLTQQLIKQVYFADEAQSENRGGLSRKIKELILAVELEKMYDKEQILTMYLNESPYGGRRNGVESASQTYFGKTSKDLTIAEAALLAAIPNNPAIYNPYNTAGNETLIERQQYAIQLMAEMGYITKEEAEEAKKVAVLDTIKPEASQYENMLAPHFVLEVKEQLEEKYGYSTLRSGGFTIKTTLDYRAQQAAEAAVATGASMFNWNGSDNIALASVDVETSQVIAMVGSVDFNNAEYGSFNAATSLVEPGSSIKPVLDYTPLFMQREGMNYGPGTILRDENIDSIYCNGYRGSCMLRNYTGIFYGNKTIRQELSNSLNIPAVKALYINGIQNSLDILHKLGDVSYCAEDPASAGLSIAIGSGCRVRLIEHANTYATLARGGSFKELAYVLEVKNSAGDVLESWKDSAGERVVDEQVAYMIWSILHDAVARSQLAFGAQSYSYGFIVPGVETASKTGTTTTANSAVTKDSLMVSYSSRIATAVWNGKHDGSGLWNSDNSIVRRVVNDYMESVHKNVYGPDGKWAYGDQLYQPAGMHTMTVNGVTDIWPSWYNEKTSGVTKETLQFNRYNHKLAASCTNPDYIESVEITKVTDPMTKKDVYNVPDGYDKENSDDCSYVAPHVGASYSASSKTISVTATGSEVLNGGTYVLTTAAGAEVARGKVGSSTSFTPNYTAKGTEGTITVTVTDKWGFSDSSMVTIPPAQTTPQSSSSSDE
ncbi:transglycosylase domain-containing protein [Candidatus Saccharibacteria bacterium]|nr:transglycosylase domain-containing protein [Candidatus Saccharibacteria bacterium]